MDFFADLDLTQMILLALGLVAVIAVASFAVPFMKSRKRAARIEEVVSKRRGELSRQQMDGLTHGSALRQRKDKVYVAFAKAVMSQLRLDTVFSTKKVRDFLSQAGYRGKNAITLYAFSRLVGAGAGTVAAIVLIGLMEEFDYPFIVKMGLWGLGGVIGFFLPKVIISNATQKRQQEITKAFPDAMDLMVICVESGLTVEGAFDRITHEIGEASPILSQEIGLATAELAFLGDRSRAYQNFGERTGVPAVKSLATALVQSEKYGTPVSIAIKVLANEKRGERMAAAEKKAAALPATLTVPMIVFFLPLLFMVVIGPAIIQVIRM